MPRRCTQGQCSDCYLNEDFLAACKVDVHLDVVVGVNKGTGLSLGSGRECGTSNCQHGDIVIVYHGYDLPWLRRGVLWRR